MKYTWLFIILLTGMITDMGCSAGSASPDSLLHGGRETLVQSVPVQYVDDTNALSGFPVYPGMEQLSEPVEFEWKNLNAAYKIPYSQWAYYTVRVSYPEVAAFYKSKSAAPPFTNISLYWKETGKGALGAWFQEASLDKYIRIWFIPDPDNDRNSYLIVMRNNDISSCSIF